MVLFLCQIDTRKVNASREPCLVQKRQLLLRANDLSGCLSDQVFEGSSDMRLIEVAGFVNRVEDRGALLQEVRRMSGAFNLTNSAVGHTRRLQKMPLCRPYRQFLLFTS